MASTIPPKIQQKLSALYKLIQQNKSEQALPQLMSLLKKWPQSADVMHLVALGYKQLGDAKTAKRYFLRSLELNKRQPQVHNNLANLYKLEGHYKSAVKHYLLAISLNQNYLDALRNLAVCYAAQQDYERALEAYDQVLKRHAKDVSGLTGKADCLRNLGDCDQAQEFYKVAIEIDPRHLNAWHNMGLNYHLQGEIYQALECYEKAYKIAPNQTEVILSLASTMHEAGSTSDAIDLFKSALQDNPGGVELHQRLNDIVWESKESDQFGDSYRRAIVKVPDSLEIRLSYISQLFSANHTDLAKNELNAALLLFNKSSELLSLQGQIQAEEARYADADNSLSASLDQQYSKNAAQTLVKICLIEGQLERAEELLKRLLDFDPNCQLTWALQSLVWRLCNDSRYHWLNDYEQFVRPYTIEAPNGYSSLEEFLQALEHVLIGLHKTEHAPLQQTLRNGTQTAARLLHKPIPELVELRQCLSDIVHEYVSELPDDPNHPLLRRKYGEFEFAGSWSVKLRPDGFHVNHVHPAGWISSACYISLPLSMLDTTDDQQGHIKFGESPLFLGEREVIEKTIVPQAGTVVLFPSYMWHGTFPFTGSDTEFRLTAPFDIVPKNTQQD